MWVALVVVWGIRVPMSSAELQPAERQVTHAHHGHILTNVNVWSPDGHWLVYDVRSDPAGSVFDGRRIERVNVDTGQVQVLYESPIGAYCGVATYDPTGERVVFIHGPERPTEDWHYCAYHRRGVIVRVGQPGLLSNLDARQLLPPFIPGALRGGTHVHVFSPDGQWVSHTYEDHVLAVLKDDIEHDQNQRNIGVSVLVIPVRVRRDHPRNHDGTFFTVLVTRTVNRPRPGSDEIDRAFSDAWVGTCGYCRADGSRQRRAIALLGNIVTGNDKRVTELFLVDLPDDLAHVGKGPLAGTMTRRPAPPCGTVQRRLTFTANRKYPGIQGPRHWPRSCPDGSCIAFLMKDDSGIVQLWTIAPTGGRPRQLTHNAFDVASAFTWSCDGRLIAHVMDGSVCVTRADTGTTVRLTARAEPRVAPRPEACVFSPDGRRIAFVRPVHDDSGTWNQIVIVNEVRGER